MRNAHTVFSGSLDVLKEMQRTDVRERRTIQLGNVLTRAPPFAYGVSRFAALIAELDGFDRSHFQNDVCRVSIGVQKLSSPATECTLFHPESKSTMKPVRLVATYPYCAEYFQPFEDRETFGWAL